MYHRHFYIFLFVVLSACTPISSGCRAISSQHQYCLQPNNTALLITEQTQLNIHVNQSSDTLIANTEVDRTGTRMAILSPLGQTIASVSISANGEIQSSRADKKIDPQWLLVLLQWTRWPKEAVETGFGNHIQILETPFQRDIMSGNVLIFRAIYLDEHREKPLSMHIPNMHIDVDVTPLEQ